MNINPRAARRQAAICIALIRELERAVTELNQPADQYLAHYYRQHREYGARDRRFLSNAAFSWFRWRGWLKTPEEKNIAAAILLDAQTIPPQLEYMLAGSGLNSTAIKPLGALTLEEKGEHLQHELNTSCLHLVPPWFPDFIFIPEQKENTIHLQQCLRAFQSRPPTWLRLPANRIQPALSVLHQAGIETETHPALNTAALVKGGQSFDPAQFPEIEVQDLASQCVGICCAPRPGDQWWDMCAGAGGKSLHLADLMQDRGSILATDIRPAILHQLSKRLQKSGKHPVKPLLWNGSADPAPATRFDGILIDAPCSGLGTWPRNPDARWRIDAKQIAEYAGLQKKLLETAAAKLKPGGRLVYSTCTLTRTENSEVIAAFLEQNHQFQLEKTVNPLNGEPAGGTIWIWPWEWRCNGMFIAVIAGP